MQNVVYIAFKIERTSITVLFSRDRKQIFLFSPMREQTTQHYNPRNFTVFHGIYFHFLACVVLI
jgi:hypothetical protein